MADETTVQAETEATAPPRHPFSVGDSVCLIGFSQRMTVTATILDPEEDDQQDTEVTWFSDSGSLNRVWLPSEALIPVELIN